MSGSHLRMQVQDSATHGIAGSAFCKSGSARVLHVILGSDRALASRSLDTLLSGIAADGFDIDRIEAASSSFDAIFAAATAAPFFGSRRVLVLTGFLAQMAPKAGRAAKGKTEGDLQRLTESLPESTSLVLFDPDLGELEAKVRKQLPPDVPISINEAPRGNALMALAQELAAQQGSTLDGRTTRALLDKLFPGYWPQAPQNRAFDKPPSVALLTSEIAKLALASYPGPITIQIIDDLVPQRIEDRIFPMLDAVTAGNQANAIREVRNALRTGEDPSRATSQLYQQIELIVGALAQGRPGDPSQAARALGGISPYRLNKVTEAGQRARTAPARQLRFALETDRKLKSGRLRNPEEALIDLVVRTTQPQENR